MKILCKILSAFLLVTLILYAIVHTKKLNNIENKYKQINIEVPYVLSEMFFSLEDHKIGTINNTLSYPIYYDKYGSYILAKRTGLTYIEGGTVYRGIEMEDGNIRYILLSIVEDAYYGFELYPNIPKELHPWEKMYFNGAMTESDIITTLVQLKSTTDGRPDKLLFEFWDSQYEWYQYLEDTCFKNEDDILDYLKTMPDYKDYIKVISCFGKKCLYSSKDETYIFVEEGIRNNTVVLIEIHEWKGNSNYYSVIKNVFYFDLEDKTID